MDGKFKIFVIVAIVVLALAIAGSTFFVMKAMSGNPAQQATTEAAPKEPEVLREIALGDAIMTNIAMESNNIQHYAKMKISIGIDGDDSKAADALSAKITEKSASIRNEIIATIGEQTFTMLSDTKAGKEKLADEIIVRLNKLLDTEMIKAVYYEEYFIQ